MRCASASKMNSKRSLGVAELLARPDRQRHGVDVPAQAADARRLTLLGRKITSRSGRRRRRGVRWGRGELAQLLLKRFQARSVCRDFAGVRVATVRCSPVDSFCWCVHAMAEALTSASKRVTLASTLRISCLPWAPKRAKLTLLVSRNASSSQEPRFGGNDEGVPASGAEGRAGGTAAPEGPGRRAGAKPSTKSRGDHVAQRVQR